MDISQISIGVAFLAGLLSFLSPCMLPLVPLFVAQLAGQTTYQATQERAAFSARFLTFFHAVLFVIGFSFAFIALGASASVLGSFLRAYQFELRQVGGILLIIIGLHVTGVLKIPLLYRQKRFVFHSSRPGYIASLLTGIIFAIGWTPCIGLLLGSVLGLAATTTTLRQGVSLLIFYSLGMGVPFLLLGLGLNSMSRFLSWLKPYLGKIEVGTGIVMMSVGVMIFFNWLAYLNRYAAPLVRW